MDFGRAVHECQLRSAFILFISEKCVILLDGGKIDQIGIATRKYWFYDRRSCYRRRYPETCPC
jgi:hypothetical protein